MAAGWEGTNREELYSELEKMGYKWGLKSAQKQIPQFIMQANNDVVKTFLRSYFDAEGYVNPNCRQI